MFFVQKTLIHNQLSPEALAYVEHKSTEMFNQLFDLSVEAHMQQDRILALQRIFANLEQTPRSFAIRMQAKTLEIEQCLYSILDIWIDLLCMQAYADYANVAVIQRAIDHISMFCRGCLYCDSNKTHYALYALQEMRKLEQANLQTLKLVLVKLANLYMFGKLASVDQLLKFSSVLSFVMLSRRELAWLKIYPVDLYRQDATFLAISLLRISLKAYLDDHELVSLRSFIGALGLEDTEGIIQEFADAEISLFVLLKPHTNGQGRHVRKFCPT